jgi:hypothetical protein
MERARGGIHVQRLCRRQYLAELAISILPLWKGDCEKTVQSLMRRLAHADDDHDALVLLERLVRMEVKAAINAKKIAADGLDAVQRKTKP